MLARAGLAIGAGSAQWRAMSLFASLTDAAYALVRPIVHATDGEAAHNLTLNALAPLPRARHALTSPVLACQFAHAAAGLALGQRQAGVEQVDQEGLAAADAAPQEQAVGRLAAAGPEQPVQQAAARRIDERVVDAVEFAQHRALRGIVAPVLARHAFGVSLRRQIGRAHV